MIPCSQSVASKWRKWQTKRVHVLLMLFQETSCWVWKRERWQGRDSWPRVQTHHQKTHGASEKVSHSVLNLPPDQKKYTETSDTGIYFLSVANIALCIVFAPAIKIEIAIITDNFNYLCSKTLTAPYGTHKFFLKTRTHSAKLYSLLTGQFFIHSKHSWYVITNLLSALLN